MSEHRVSLGIFDAMGHGMPAALIAAAALAAYRSARRDARGVLDQASAIDDVVASTFPGSVFVTGVLTELDVASGQLRYVNAGHPAPLLLRQGRVVKELGGGRRVPFGLGRPARTSARRSSSRATGWRCTPTASPRPATRRARGSGRAGCWSSSPAPSPPVSRPPETVRRLTQAVMQHQGGLLQDDATVLLARWTRPATAEPPRG